MFSINTKKNTHSQYIILISFARQQWLRERASLLRQTYIVHCTLYIAWHVLCIYSPGVRVKWRDSVFCLRYELNVSSAWMYCGRNVPAVHVGTHKFMRLSCCYCLRPLGSRSGVRGFVAMCCKNPYGCSERTDVHYFSLFVLLTTIQLTPPSWLL